MFAFETSTELSARATTGASPMRTAIRSPMSPMAFRSCGSPVYVA